MSTAHLLSSTNAMPAKFHTQPQTTSPPPKSLWWETWPSRPWLFGKSPYPGTGACNARPHSYNLVMTANYGRWTSSWDVARMLKPKKGIHCLGLKKAMVAIHTVVPMEITFMDTEDEYKKYCIIRSLRYIYSNPFMFLMSSLGTPNFFLRKAERGRWQNRPPMLKHWPDRIQNRNSS